MKKHDKKRKKDNTIYYITNGVFEETASASQTGESLGIPASNGTNDTYIKNASDKTNLELSNIIAGEVADNPEVHKNLRTTYLITTEDKARLCIIDYNNKLENALKPRYSIVSLGGLALTLITTFVSTDFKKFIISADAWKVIYIVGTIISITFLIKSIIEFIKFSKPEDNYLIQKLKNVKDKDVQNDNESKQ